MQKFTPAAETATALECPKCAAAVMERRAFGTNETELIIRFRCLNCGVDNLLVFEEPENGWCDFRWETL